MNPICSHIMAVGCGLILFCSVAHSKPVQEIWRLDPETSSHDGRFGLRVAIEEDIAVVGAVRRLGGPGSVLTYDVKTGEFLTELTPSLITSDAEFGRSVAIDSNTIIVGAPRDSSLGLRDHGSAYVFDAKSGKQIFKLNALDPGSGDLFGWSIDVCGDHAIISGHHNDLELLNTGSAYIFDLNTGKQIMRLVPEDPGFMHNFGNSVSISGNYALVGAESDDTNVQFGGSAYIFDVETGKQLHKIQPEELSPNSVFGQTVSIHNNRAFIASPFSRNRGNLPGTVYVFDVATGKMITRLSPPPETVDSQFGSSISLSDEGALIGAPSEIYEGIASGAAYLHDIQTGRLVDVYRVSDGDELDDFGRSVSLSGSYAIIGAPRVDGEAENSGRAYIFGPSNSCTADCDGSQHVDINDLIIMLYKFNSNITDIDTSCDIDGSGTITFDDLVLALGYFGPCLQ